MKYVRHFFIEGHFLGSGPAARRIIHEQLAAPIGFSFFCTHCGRLWAECPVEGERHMVWARTCMNHPPTSLDIPGSILMPWEPEFISDFPEPVWNWELQIHLRWASTQLPPPVASAALELYRIINRRR